MTANARWRPCRHPSPLPTRSGTTRCRRPAGRSSPPALPGGRRAPWRGEIVHQLIEQGAEVAFLDLDAGDSSPGDARFIRCDVRDIAALQGVVQQVAEELGTIDILVNNAARDDRIRFDEVDVARWDEQIDVNVRHHFFATQAVAPFMRRAGGGSIITMGSISAHIDLRDLAGFVTAKAGIEGLTRTLARELGRDRIRVNCVIPGWIMTERQLRDWVTPEAEGLIEASQALPEKLVPADVARLVLWLAADDSRLCTGQRWIVDGGWM
ncbi:SDR family NAD(P)-dependent oxidoreductase [Microbacterium sp. LMI12-1-1.1]|uniref:SDR family NAD(P)-dependent oxidoreductase n=1 Tax=Microbacterium sp. LMI12-1-1.1 TaxID=3135225 RepID=UPI0034453367